MIRRPVALMLMLAACGGKTEPDTVADIAQAEVPDPDQQLRVKTAAEVLAAMDLQADPCTDFYRYACGGWLDSTERPADQASWSRSFSVIQERNREILKGLLEQAAADPGAGGDDPAAASDWKRLGEFYGSCMDVDAVNAAKLEPIMPILDDIGALKSNKDLPALLGRLHAVGVDGFWSWQVWGDLKDPDTNMAYIGQAGLGLPDRDYYLRDDEASVALQQSYRDYVAQLLEMSGVPADQAEKNADEIYALEKKIAEFSLPKEQLRDPNKIYNPRNAAALTKLAPSLDLPGWAATAGISTEQPLSVEDVGWFQALDKLVAGTDPALIRRYLRFHALSGFADQLPEAWGEARFAFYGQKIYGQAQQKARWKRCVDHANSVLGEALGRHYVARHFAGDSKEIALTMVGGIEGAFVGGLPELSWMDDDTRQRAEEKAGTLTEKIGYPDTWLDTSSMAIAVQPYAANAIAARRFHIQREANKVGLPVDPTEWFMPPAMVNAYYNPLENEMVFPAGILQPPFFHRAFPAPMNYGAIGMVIGHELTHGFDDEGRKFDKDGKLTEWWEPEASERFIERAQCVDDQYDGFEAVDGMTVNGKLTLGENIADLGGVKLAYDAWKAWEAENGTPDTMVPDLNADQLFFVAYAQGWCTIMSPELEKMLVTTNPHSPPRFRVNGPLENTPVFHQVFSCEAGDAMVREPMCEVW